MMLTDGENTIKWYYVENRYHDYCVPDRDLVVTDSSLVGIGDEVKFNYFSKSYDGIIRSVSDNEDKILNEIEAASVQRKKKGKKDSSFHEDRPRQAAVKQQARMAQMMAPKQGCSKDPQLKKKQVTAKEARNVKKLKEKADIEMQKLLRNDSDQLKDFNRSCASSNGDKLKSSVTQPSSKSDSISNDDSDNSSSSDGDTASSSSTIHSLSNQTLKVKDSKDFKKLKVLSKSKDNLVETNSAVPPNIKNEKAKEGVLKVHAERNRQSNVNNDSERLKIKEMEKEIRRKEEELKSKQEEMARKEEEMKRKEEEIKRKEEEMKKMEDNAQLKEVLKSKALPIKKKEKQRNKKKSQGRDSSSDSDPGSSAESLTVKGISAKNKNPETEMQETAGCSNYQESNNSFVSTSDTIKMPNSDSELEFCDSEQNKKKQPKRKRNRSPSSSDFDVDSSSSSNSDSSSSDSALSDSSEPRSKPKRSKKKTEPVERNMEIYPGVNYNYTATDSEVVKLHDSFNVFVKKCDLDSALKLKNQSLFVRNLLEKVYTREALLNTTPTGHPPRSKGAKFCKKGKIPPRLHPDGLSAIIQRCLDAENSNKKWRPRMLETVLMTRISNKCCELTRKFKNKNKRLRKSDKK